ncbi:glucose/galactose transporter [Ameyamaea chiangmaiensis NBRC 103196]|uniref:Sugar MFS transporter n=1 Tax=Ameyamaea chiangmaiensis TaxID=442969 RepID=A0A850PGB0_9PROT|nr:sugar MFS transporter [Ameyamaea chiangmaiensis]MBS4074898.1 sugar MFS transporter [Ameyamaea chiangmaiensis]NVN41873.1 sugar MFS transporter [Ameyamaea chiangmaiensis]GBQ63148.1 glucose/galactose transporter [Ameyamaea chiangmaiensis NBRC 103196]
MRQHLRSPAGEHGWAPVVLTATLFFLIGFVTWLNGPLISFVRVAFTLDDASAFLVPFAFYISYFFFAVPAALAVRATGLKRGLALALVIMACGSALFGQFLTERAYPGALCGLTVLGAGLALLQVSVNPYVSLLGPPDRAAQRIAIMGLCNKGAGILAPIVLAVLVMHDIGGVVARAQAATDVATREAILSRFAHAVHAPALCMAGLELLAAVWVVRSRLPDLAAPDIAVSGSLGGLLSRPRLVFGAAAMFVYVGVEVMAGDAIGTYGQGFGLPIDQTKFFTALTLSAMMAGYAAGMVLVPRVVDQERYLGLSCLLGIALTLMAFATHGYVSVLCVAALGFANAMMFPAIFPIAIAGSGRDTPLAAALLVMAFSGGALVPQMFVWLKAAFGFQGVFATLMIPSYLFILLYARLASATRSTDSVRAATA